MHDVIVAGSGPAGSTVAALLAQQRYNVLMIERDRHPRFHIGESLLPLGEPVFQRLGIRWDSKEYLPKGGAEFIDEKTGQFATFPLAGQHQPYQVERDKFDLMMVENATRLGVHLHQSESVKTVNCSEPGVQVKTDKAEYSARYFIDATGRSALMGRLHASIRRFENLGRYAFYTHYRNALSDTAQALYATGYVKVLMLDIGWLWIIPLVNNRLSVGLIVQKDPGPARRKPELFDEYLKASPILTALLKGARQEAPVRAEADFSFTNTRRYGLRFACCGDSSGFLDPVFSSGVFLAVTSAERVADRLHPALQRGTEADNALHAEDDKAYLFGFNSMHLFVERFYHNDIVHHLFFEAARSEDVRNDIMGLLSGDLWTENNRFQKKLLAGRQSKKLG